jgi:hypothetical protein
MNARNWAFSLEVRVMRLLYGAYGCRPSSAPYLSGDGFRSLCGHLYEGEKRAGFTASAVRPDALIFCEAWYLEEFFKGPAGEIRVPFSVVSHNGDMNVDKAIIDLAPATMKKLFAQNLVVKDPRAVAVPIGLENRRFHCNGITGDFENLRRKTIARSPRILTAFSVGTNPALRGPAEQQLAACPLNDTVSRMNSRAYRCLASRYMFVSSPPGNGLDCHRTWEAMYLRSVPIVLRSAAMEAFEALGMPMLVVDSYEELADWNEAQAIETRRKLEPRFDSEALWFDYWRRIIMTNHGAP